MDGSELLKLFPNARGFFVIGEFPGVILAPDNQGWLFEGGVPHPITKSEVLARGGHPALADEVAELLTRDHSDVLKSMQQP